MYIGFRIPVDTMRCMKGLRAQSSTSQVTVPHTLAGSRRGQWLSLDLRTMLGQLASSSCGPLPDKTPQPSAITVSQVTRPVKNEWNERGEATRRVQDAALRHPKPLRGTRLGPRDLPGATSRVPLMMRGLLAHPPSFPFCASMICGGNSCSNRRSCAAIATYPRNGVRGNGVRE